MPNSTPEILDVLMIGCGQIAGGFDEGNPESARSHAGAYRRHAGFRIAACVDPDVKRRETYMTHWGVPEGFDRLEHVKEAGIHFDVTSVCSPTEQHADDLKFLLETNTQAVFCEKPIAEDFDAARDLVAAFEEAKIPLAVNHLRRWDTRLAALRDEIAVGDWGQIRSAVGLYTKGILNNGTHLVDLMQFLLGPLKIVARGPHREDGHPGDPTVDAMLTLTNGATAHLVGGDSRDYALFELTIITEKGVIALEEAGYTIRIRKVRNSVRYAGYRELDNAATSQSGLEDAMANAVGDLYDAVQNNKQPASTGRSALAAHELCEQLRVRTP